MTIPKATRTCLRCGQSLPDGSELPVCSSCALEDALRLADPSVPLAPPPDSKSAKPATALGQLGKYELVELLGRGGMGTVYKAHIPGSDEWVAIKVLAAGVFAEKSARERLKREAQALARLRHRGIVEIHEVGEVDGLPFLVMALVDGPNLAELVREHPLEPRRAARIVTRVAEAVQSAHEAGILHRDLKPSNVLLGPDDRPRLTDFGLAVADWMSRDLTRSGDTLGSPAYLSPEQISAHRGEVRVASDVYAIGAVLYHLLTGRPPFAAATPADTLEQVLRREVLAPRRLNPAVPIELEAICLRCLDKHPERRYPTAGALAEELRRFVDQPRAFAPGQWFWHHWRQARRDHPARATASLFLLIAAILGLALATGLFWRNHQLRQELARAQETQSRADIMLEGQEEQRLKLAYAHQIVAAQRAWDSGDVRAARRHLDTTDASRRGWEHRYLETLFDRHELRLKGHGNPVTEIAFHPGGEVLASVGMDLTLRLWSVSDAQEIQQTMAHEERPTGLVFSSDGRSILTGGQDRSVKIWSVDPLALEREFTLDLGRVTTVSLDRAGSRVAAGDNLGRLHLWDRATGARLLTEQGDLQGLFSVVFSPDGQLLATGGRDRSLRLWSVPEGRRLHLINGHRDVVRSLRFSPDGGLLASASDDRTICLWRVSDGVLLFTLTGHQGAVLALDFSNDGSVLASTGADGAIRLWDPRTGVLDQVLHGTSGRLNSVAISPDGQWLASGGNDPEVRLWRIDKPALTHALDGHTDAVSRLAFSRDGRWLLSGSHDGTARLWDLDTGQSQQVIADHGARVLAAALSPNNRWAVTSGSDGRCAVWDIAQARQSQVLALEQGPVRGLTFTPDSKCVASSHDSGGVRIWDVATLHPILDIRTETRQINRLAFDPTGTSLYTAGLGAAEVEVWNASTGELRNTFRLPHGQQTALLLAPEGDRIGGGNNLGMVYVMDAESGGSVWSVHGHSKAVSQVAWSPDGERLASCSRDGSLRIWDGRYGYELLLIRDLFSEGFALAWSYDGQQLAAAGRSGRIWVIGLQRATPR
jgi:eukaryotic-like serine/threonine-protein kinase